VAPRTRFQRKPETVERRQRVVDLRIRGWQWTQIAIELGVSYQRCQQLYDEAMTLVNRASVEKARELENMRLDAMEMSVWKVLDTAHVVIQQGKIVGIYVGVERDPETNEVLRDHNDKPVIRTEPVPDDAPVLQAVDRLLRIADRRAKLNGLDASIKIKLEGDDDLDTDIEKMIADLSQNDNLAQPEGREELSGSDSAQPAR